MTLVGLAVGRAVRRLLPGRVSGLTWRRDHTLPPGVNGCGSYADRRDTQGPWSLGECSPQFPQEPSEQDVRPWLPLQMWCQLKADAGQASQEDLQMRELGSQPLEQARSNRHFSRDPWETRPLKPVGGMLHGTPLAPRGITAGAAAAPWKCQSLVCPSEYTRHACGWRTECGLVA